jgi:hypothetical protein
MRTILTIALCVFLFYFGSNLAARLQVYEEATFFDRGGAVYEGRVTRNILTGDYLIASRASPGKTTNVPADQIAGLAYVASSGVTVASTLAMVGTMLLILIALSADLFYSLRKRNHATPAASR